MGENVFREVEGYIGGMDWIVCGGQPSQNTWRTDDSQVEDPQAGDPVNDSLCSIQMRKVIQMDGDNYLVTILSDGLLIQIFKNEAIRAIMAEQGGLTSDNLEKEMVLCQGTGIFELCAPADPSSWPGKDTVLCHWANFQGKLSKPVVLNEEKRRYRPVLIPLTPEKEVDFSMRALNEDGALVSGGELVFKDGFFWPRKLEIVDSGSGSGQELQWMWFHGLLVNVNAAIPVPPSFLLDQNLVSELILSEKFW